ncbi:MAG: nitrite reductase small subunit NirD [Burkholderiales bacterium]
MNNAWIKACALEDIPVLGARVVRRKEGDIAVFRNGDNEVFALRDKCPHKGGPLSQGIVFGKRVTCPLHGWTINLENGKAVEPDQGCAHSYPCKVEEGVVFLDPTPLATAGSAQEQAA